MKKIIASLLSLLTLTAGAVGAEFSEEETFSETVSLPIVMYHHLSPKQNFGESMCCRWISLNGI